VSERALIFGGGGSAGNAWEIGVIAGLFDAGLDVTEADLIIGTSAGSTAAAQIASATLPTELLANILASAPQPRTGPVGSGPGRVRNVPVANHMEITSGIIGAAEDAADMIVFDRYRGVDLVDAVAASCANGFGVAPYSIGDNRYIDGGYRSNENADLAAGYARVLVLSPFGGRSRTPVDWGMHLATQVEELRSRGSSVETIFPDDDSRNAFGDNVMDPSTRPPAARAGHNQGRALAEQLTEFWH
jgi:NTE family protein